MSTVPPCAGLFYLFDSTELRDHRRARELCGTCPMIAACRKRLEQAATDTYGGSKYGPRGTWAGLLLGGPKTSHQRAQAEDLMFDEDEARKAHARYAAGERDARTVIGERVYNRRMKRERYARRAAA